MHGEGEDTGSSCDATLHPHTKKDEDQICIFHDTVDECIPSEVGNIAGKFAVQIAHVMATGLQETLPFPAKNVLQGA